MSAFSSSHNNFADLPLYCNDIFLWWYNTYHDTRVTV